MQSLELDDMLNKIQQSLSKDTPEEYKVLSKFASEAIHYVTNSYSMQEIATDKNLIDNLIKLKTLL